MSSVGRALAHHFGSGRRRHESDDDASIARQRRTALIGHLNDEVGGLRLAYHWRLPPNGMVIFRIPQLDLLLVAASFGILKPQVAQAISIGVGAAGGAHHEAFAGFDGQPIARAELYYRRMIRLLV